MKTLTVAGICLAFTTAYPAGAATGAASDPKILKTQVLLDRLGFGPGVIDGRKGWALTEALKGLQTSRGIAVTGQDDAATEQALDAYKSTPPVITVTLTADDLAGPFVGPIPSDAAAQAKLPAMGYSDAMEELAERYHTTPATLTSLNGSTPALTAGATIKVPNVRPAASDYPASFKPEWRAMLAQLSVSSDQPQAARIVVSKSDRVLRVYDADDKLVAQFPATMGSKHDPLPLGDWKIQGTSYLPTFHFNPALFWDAKATDTKQTIQPGPNGPVGVVWMDLSKPHYGIHGTPRPETIGRAESHGCIRLSNWDAARLSMMVKPGTPAVFQP